MGIDPREMMTMFVVEKYNVNLVLLFALDRCFQAILDGITVSVYSVPIGPGVISLCDQWLLVTYMG